MRLTTNIKLSVTLLALCATVVGALFYLNGGATSPTRVHQESLWRNDIHTLSKSPNNKVVFVEFVDFECGACVSMSQTMDRIRAEYADRITIGVRYYASPGHRNAHLAARAVESAARQGKFIAMYQQMFEAQTQWGGSPDSAEAIFRSFARDLGLNMAQFDRDLNDPTVVERVESDFIEGRALGVRDTGTLFLNGRKLEPLPSFDLLKAEIEKALDK